jgi:hypothetical protein
VRDAVISSRSGAQISPARAGFYFSFAPMCLFTAGLGLFYRGLPEPVTVETIGEAWNSSWSLHLRCLDEGREGLKHKRRCDFRTELDVQTLVCTCGRDFPLAHIAERLGVLAAVAVTSPLCLGRRRTKGWRLPLVGMTGGEQQTVGARSPRKSAYLIAGTPARCFLPNCHLSFSGSCVHSRDGRFCCSQNCADESQRVDLSHIEEMTRKRP